MHCAWGARAPLQRPLWPLSIESRYSTLPHMACLPPPCSVGSVPRAWSQAYLSLICMGKQCPSSLQRAIITMWHQMLVKQGRICSLWMGSEALVLFFATPLTVL